jgi:hypothetical protein
MEKADDALRASLSPDQRTALDQEDFYAGFQADYGMLFHQVQESGFLKDMLGEGTLKF